MTKKILPERSEGFWFRVKALFVLLVICILVVVLRISMFDFPLDYDVGGHLFYGMEVAKNGFYSILQEIRPVGILTIFAIIYRFFGSSAVAVQAIGAFFWTISAILVYGIARMLFRSGKTAILSSLFFVLFSASRSMQGEMANLEAFFLPFCLLAIFLYFLFKEKRKYLFLYLSGFFFGIGFVIKQTAGFDFAAMVIYNFFVIFPFARGIKNKEKLKRFFFENSLLLLGFITPMLFYLIYFFIIGKMSEFLNFQFISIFNNTKGYVVYGSALKNFWNSFVPIFAKTGFFWILSILGMLCFFKSKGNTETNFLFIWLTVNLVGIYYLWWFFLHHFLQLIPPLSIFSGNFVSEILRINYRKINSRYKNTVIFIVLIVFLSFYLKNNFRFYPDFIRKSLGKISRKEYLARVGFEVGINGWLPFYDTADYLKQKGEKQEKMFIWGTIPAVYAFSDLTPASFFINKQSLLPVELRTTAYKNWAIDFESNRKRLINELVISLPKYIIIEVEPKKIFDEMLSFPELSRLVFENYFFEKQIGYNLIYKRNPNGREFVLDEEEKVIPFEIIKKFSIITKMEFGREKTRIIFEPIANMSGGIRELSILYPQIIKFKKEDLTLLDLGIGEEDFVDLTSEIQDEKKDLHFKLKDINKPIIFMRIRSGDSFWTNHSYGVNAFVKVVQGSETLDLYVKDPGKWNELHFNLYIISDDGTVFEKNIPPQIN